MANLPTVGGDNDAWGGILNTFLQVSHNDDGTEKASSDVCNIKNFGAVGDGVTVNTIAIQSAIDVVNTAGGGTVLIPEGVFLSGTLTLYSNITIIGANKHKSIIKLIDVPTDALFNIVGTSSVYKENISFERLTLSHVNNYTRDTGNKGELIFANYSQHCSILNCVFNSFSYSAIHITNTGGIVKQKSWSIHNCLFLDGKAGGSRGVYCDAYGEYVSIKNNMATDLGFFVYIMDAANTSIIGNNILRCGYGIYVWQTTSAINNGKTNISNNKINHCTTNGIKGILLASNDKGIIISSNEILFCAALGVSISGCYSSIITNNRISHSNGSEVGILLADQSGSIKSDYNVITNNIITQGVFTNNMTGINNLVSNNIVAIP